MRVNEIYREFHDKADFYVVYIQEIHPTDGWQVPANVRDEVLYAQPTTADERAELAGVCMIDLKFEIFQRAQAAAVSVGLGFGLQEIFANFVSGLILLFERPIRVGDLVTVAGTEGRVTNIRIRATTILDFDNRAIATKAGR